MSVDTNKLNETEIICPSELSFDEQDYYNDSNEKNKNESRYLGSKKSNTLINALKEFSVRFNIDDKKSIKPQKFIVTFDDIITLVKFSIESQIKINNSLNVKDYLNEISQDFTNNLNYYIFSYEKYDPNKNNNYINNIHNNTYNTNTFTNFNYTNSNTKRNKNTLNQTHTPTYVGNKKRKAEECKRNEERFDNLRNNKIRSKNEFLKNTKSYCRVNINNNNKQIISPTNKSKIKEKKKDNLNRSFVNRSAQKRNTTFISDFSHSNIEDNSRNRKLNKSIGKRKTVKNDNLGANNKRNSLSIYTACEHIRGSSFLLRNSKSRKLSCIDHNKTANNFYLNTSVDERRKVKDDKKVVYYDQNLNLGIKKKIISNNIIRPSNMANKLLQRGIKYLTEFMDLKEEESKKKHHQY